MSAPLRSPQKRRQRGIYPTLAGVFICQLRAGVIIFRGACQKRRDGYTSHQLAATVTIRAIDATGHLRVVMDRTEILTRAEVQQVLAGLNRRAKRSRSAKQNRVIFRYCTPEGEITAEAILNGSLDNIAGICSEGRNVLGMMPHPDRCSDPLLGSADGAKIFQSMALSGVSATR